MEAKLTDRKTLKLSEKGKQLGELVYKKSFSLKAEIRLTNAIVYDVTPMGVFSTTISVTKKGAEIADLKMNWRGQIVLTFRDGHEFVLKAKGTFHNKYVLENKAGEKLIQFDPKYNWKKFDYNYDITYDKKPQDILLVLLGLYASNYFIGAMSGAL